VCHFVSPPQRLSSGRTCLPSRDLSGSFAPPVALYQALERSHNRVDGRFFLLLHLRNLSDSSSFSKIPTSVLLPQVSTLAPTQASPPRNSSVKDKEFSPSTATTSYLGVSLHAPGLVLAGASFQTGICGPPSHKQNRCSLPSPQTPRCVGPVLFFYF